MNHRTCRCIVLVLLLTHSPDRLRAEPVARVFHPVVRIERLLQTAREQSLLDDRLAATLRADWGTVRLDQLGAGGLEESLIQRSEAQKILQPAQAAALVRLAASQRLADLGQGAGSAGQPWSVLDLVNSIMTWLPRLGGLLFGSGLLWMVVRFLVRAPRV